MPNPNNNSTSSRRRLVVVVIAAVVVLLALASAFIWPGWAMKNQNGSSQASQTQSAPATPTIKASALPTDATDLLKAAPDSVTNYARTGAEAAQDWASANPVEEYKVTYSTGDTTQDLTVLVGQWSDSNAAKTQYDAVAGALTGDTLAQGNVKVSGANTGTYLVKADASDKKQAVAVWQNDTAVFQVTGPKDAVLSFYQQFPL
ncbi:hypothetical protein [Bifidobacterium tissieri]|uniref:Uncharacterized protein n=1 Tax=Bifidobacterium tissieri TaxID=1630162 RepID=A0A5M9ZP73_9BIFI|nr:hypothetical protein [Bifidobacterium tissieri]KAA8829295.1 hypothetical protein EMO89_08345 [Bifidobacterium tissieri]KAA8831899.1 hypothetical protein EM849_06560 [Bifidobacterium tissieri]